MKLGMVGLPNVGKSTLFNALTCAGAESANYPFCTIEPNVGMVSVPDHRLTFLEQMYHPKKVTPAVLEFVDIAGLVKGASKGEGLGNQFLASIREVDALIHVVRCFDDPNIVHVDGSIGPARDIETICLELILSDIEILERRMVKMRKAVKSDPKLRSEIGLLERLIQHLEEGKTARTFVSASDEEDILQDIPLLSSKPVIYAANLKEDDFINDLAQHSFYQQVVAVSVQENACVLPICARIEEEIADMSDEDKAMFLAEMNLDQSGLDRMIREGYALMGLISYLTAGADEVRAWTIQRGTKAPQAAGKIHTDFERGFIRAEIISFEHLKECGSMTAAKEKGLVRLEGKEYVMADGDIVNFRFHV